MSCCMIDKLFRYEDQNLPYPLHVYSPSADHRHFSNLLYLPISIFLADACCRSIDLLAYSDCLDGGMIFLH
jgi:hypothetical protein